MLGHTPPPEYNKKENARRLREGLENHIRVLAERVLEKYGPIDSMDSLKKILQDREVVRFPTEITFEKVIEYDVSPVDLRQVGNEPGEGFKIIFNGDFVGNDEAIIALSLYKIASINYLKIVREEESLLFASLLMGLDSEAYGKKIEEFKNKT